MSGARAQSFGSSPTSPPPLWAWGESAAITALAPLVGWLIDRADPLMRARPFPWIVLAPLLVGLRHGFARAFVCAAALCVAVLARERPASSATIELCFGIVIAAMLAGEFTAVRERRLARAEAASAYRRARLGEFSRAFHLLRVSHDRLEQRLVGSTQSLREAILGVQRQLRETEVGGAALREQGDRILGLFTGLGLLQVAALYEIDDRGRLVTPSAAVLGEPPPLTSDPMIDDALARKQLAHVQSDARGAEGSALLAAVPLVDVNGRAWGVIAVHGMPFIAFQEASLKLLSVVAGHVADMLAAHATIPGAGDPDRDELARQLHRCIDDRKRHDLRASLLGIVVKERTVSDRLVDQIAHKWRRGLDVAWVLKNPTGAATIFILMPLTDMRGVGGYEARLTNQIREEYGAERAAAAIDLHAFEVEPDDTAEGVLRRLADVCRVEPSAAPPRMEAAS